MRPSRSSRTCSAVVALVRHEIANSVKAWADGYLADDSIYTASATWEQLYGLTKARDGLAPLRDYMADKSVNLRPAFTL